MEQRKRNTKSFIRRIDYYERNECALSKSGQLSTALRYYQRANLKVTTPLEQIDEFDISYWISYAHNYAHSIGFTLDETATESWDNPISANVNNKNMGADIESRLNRYKNVEGFTSVWI